MKLAAGGGDKNTQQAKSGSEAAVSVHSHSGGCRGSVDVKEIITDKQERRGGLWSPCLSRIVTQNVRKQEKTVGFINLLLTPDKQVRGDRKRDRKNYMTVLLFMFCVSLHSNPKDIYIFRSSYNNSVLFVSITSL